MAIQIVNIWTSNGATEVDREHVHLSLQDEDVVVWQGNIDFDVDFGGNSPFSSAKFSGGKGNPASSGKATKRQAGKSYKYTAQGKGASVKDPIIHTDT